MPTTKHGRFIFIKRGQRPQKTSFHSSTQSTSQAAFTLVIPLIGAIIILYIIRYATTYAGYYISKYYLIGLGFLIFLPLYLHFYDLYEESIMDPDEPLEEESKNDVIIDTVERKLIIHDTHLKEDFSIPFKDITGFDVKIDVTVEEGVKTAWTAWVYDKEKSVLLGASVWKEDLEDLVDMIKTYLESKIPEEDFIELYGKAYKVLGLGPEASVMEVKTAYRELAKKYHPDIGGEEDIFKRINEAYQSLIEER